MRGKNREIVQNVDGDSDADEGDYERLIEGQHDHIVEYEEEEGEDENKRSVHRLEYVEEGFIQKMKCVKCGFFITEHEACFACSGCPYTTHKACTELPRTISGHPCAAARCKSTGFEVLRLRLRPLSFTKQWCYYCRKAVREAVRGDAAGPFYELPHPFYDPLYMHATCALIPLPAISVKGEYICHRRPMSLVLDEEEAGDAACFSCGVPRWGSPVYRCTGARRCKIFFHKSCAEVPGTTRHPRHEHDLRLAVGRPETCWVCRKTGCRHVYYCKWRRAVPQDYDEEDCEDFALGAECNFHSTSGRLVTSHEHGIFLAEGRTNGFRCDGCRKSHGGAVPAEVHRTRDMSFRCRECAFNLHFLCGPLPSAAKFGCHIHPMRLVDLLIEDDSGEYYCDVCEEERDPRFRVYYCAECKFVAHIHCLHSEILKILKEESTTDVELMILGESPLNGSTEIDRVKAMPKSTLPLTEEEKKKLSVVIYESDSSTDKIFNQDRRLMRFLEGNKENEIDVDIAEEFFHLNSTDFSELCSKFSHLRPERLFELYDEYRNMKVVDIGGYIVPRALASDLKMLLHKYGDLGGNLNVTPRMKSIAATLLCAVVNKMRNSMAEDMSINDLKDWMFCINCAKEIAGYKVRELGCFQESVMTTFLGYEAIKFEKEANESVDFKIAELESELENWKGKRKKLKELASTKSDFLKECLRRAAGSKWKSVHKLL